MDEKKIVNLIDALADLLGDDTREFGIEDVDVIDVDDPLATGVGPLALTGTVFRVADYLELDAETFGFAIARLQHEFSNITGTVPVARDVFEVLAGGEELTGELADTIEGMCSDDHEKRFVAEYRQTKLRYKRLCAMATKYEAGTLEFEPKCPLDLLKEQVTHMWDYLRCLETRAEIEGIDLGKE